MLDAGPQSAPKLAREYRETIAAIKAIEGGEADGAGGDQGQDVDPSGFLLAFMPKLET